MNIYIYGSKSFKKNINKLLSKANIIFKLEDSGTITEISNVEELKGFIVQSPRDIFLIDENKIIKKGGVDFLKPKDGIERTFLNQYGVGDLSADTFDDLVDHINARIELKQSQNEDLSTSIKSIDIDNMDIDTTDNVDIENDENNLNIDEISDSEDKIISSTSDDYDEDVIEDDENTKEDDMEEEFGELNIDDIDNLDTIDDENGLDELDELDESLLMDALEDDDLIIDDMEDNSSDSSIEEPIIANNDNITLDTNQLGALTEVLSKLLNGKELEITIKVK